ncbi:MAG: alpha-galactosidase [Ruminococcus sp.]|nr:alpha-galactosidase [Ruminococcus sp.]
MKRINIYENGIYLVLEINDGNEPRLLHFSALPFDEKTLTSRTGTTGFKLVELQVSGIDRAGERHGNKYIVTAPGYRMKFKDFSDTNNSFGRKLEITCIDEPTGLETVSHLQFYTGTSAVRSWTVVTNNGSETQTVEYVSSFALTGIEKEGLRSQDEKLKIGICHNSWQRELQWQFYTLEQVGLGMAQSLDYQHSSKVLGVTNVGNWSAKEYIPMGYLENTETGSALVWQIENNGSWHWEISDQEGHLYLQLAGPSEIESHWCKNLKQGESVTSVPCAICAVSGGFDEAIGELTKYRRIIRRKNADNKKLAVIFNDYMNCLWGDPTAEKEFPLIDAAAEAGCEYFCIDAGWYADGFWWDWVGEWQESKKRFPNGLREVTDYIRKKGLIPGVWLEIEVMGIKCPLADKLPDDWFFTRHGKRVYDRSRYQLDFRNPEVREHCDEVIDRLVNTYGVGYIKMDYNIEPGIGTEHNADSFGDGLLEHQRAYIAWLDGVFERHPQLIIENCSSGGLRMDYAMLSRYSIQSTSDQDDYKRYCTIAANSPSALCPEQSAIWSYPMTSGDREEVVFNMVNAMLLRIHQSGHLGYIEPERKALVKEALDVYKKIRGDIKTALPFWSLGLSKFSDEWVSLGLKCEGKAYLAVWRRESARDTCELPVAFLKGREVKIECIYPSFSEDKFAFNKNTGAVTVRLEKQYTARLFKLSWE